MFKGDTIRLVVEFKDFEYKVIVPNDVTLTIYNTNEEVVETITNVQSNDTSFYYDYVPDADFIYEFKGIYNSLPILARQLQKVKFTKESGNC